MYFVKDIAEGEVITEDHIKSIRPGYGLAPKHYNEVVGKKAIKKAVTGTALGWEYIVK